MKEKVLVKIKGLQIMSQVQEENNQEENSEETIEIINIGSYNVVGNKEYVKYDELVEGENGKCSNLIKIADNAVEITKRGAVTAHMSFVAGEKTMTCYDTPFGNIYLGIFTRQIDILRSDGIINITIDYALELNYEHVSDCKVEMEISSNRDIKL